MVYDFRFSGGGGVFLMMMMMMMMMTKQESTDVSRSRRFVNIPILVR